jgi:photosystem II stability/assembly factor-like uncharacterized protein
LALGSPSGTPALFVLNDKTVYVAYYTAAGVEIEKTMDAGENWSKSEIQMHNGIQSAYGGSLELSFVNSSDGYLLTSSDPAAGMMGKALYSTTDGGSDWVFAGRSYVPAPGNAGMAGIAGYTTGMAFSNIYTGFITCTYHGQNEISVYKTADRGKSWAAVSLPQPAKYAALGYNAADGYYVDAYPPVFFGEGNKNAKMELFFCHDINKDKDAYIYSSDDGGVTWHIDGTSSLLMQRYSFVDNNNGFGLDDNGRLYTTDDGGITWSVLN